MFRIAALLLCFSLTCHAEDTAILPPLHLHKSQADDPILGNFLKQATKTEVTGAGSFYSSDGQEIDAIWKTFSGNTSRYPRSTRKGAGGNLILTGPVTTLNYSPLRVLSISDAVYVATYENVCEVWLDSNLTPVAWWRSDDGNLMFRNLEIVEMTGSRVFFDSTSKVFAIEEKVGAYRIASSDAPLLALCTSRLFVTHIFFDGNRIHVFGKRIIDSNGSNKLYYQSFLPKDSGREYELETEKEVKVERSVMGIPLGLNLHVEDMHIQSKVVVVRDNTFELLPVLQAFVAIDCESGKQIQQFRSRHYGFFW